MSLAVALAMKADILSVTLPRSWHKCCHANLVRPSPWLAEIDWCLLRWFSNAVEGAVERLPPQASHLRIGCSSPLLVSVYCGLLRGFHNNSEDQRVSRNNTAAVSTQFEYQHYIRGPLKKCISSFLHHCGTSVMWCSMNDWMLTTC